MRRTRSSIVAEEAALDSAIAESLVSFALARDLAVVGPTDAVVAQPAASSASPTSELPDVVMLQQAASTAAASSAPPASELPDVVMLQQAASTAAASSASPVSEPPAAAAMPEQADGAAAASPVPLACELPDAAMPEQSDSAAAVARLTALFVPLPPVVVNHAITFAARKRPAAAEPTQRPAAVEPKQRPAAVESKKRPAAVEPTQRPAAVEPKQQPAAVKPKQAAGVAIEERPAKKRRVMVDMETLDSYRFSGVLFASKARPGALRLAKMGTLVNSPSQFALRVMQPSVSRTGVVRGMCVCSADLTRTYGSTDTGVNWNTARNGDDKKVSCGGATQVRIEGGNPRASHDAQQLAAHVRSFSAPANHRKHMSSGNASARVFVQAVAAILAAPANASHDATLSAALLVAPCVPQAVGNKRSASATSLYAIPK